MTATLKKPFKSLETGQLWKIKGAHIEIRSIGKTLIDYKVVNDLGHKGRPQMTSVESMKAYLKRNGARLIKGTPRN